MSWRLPQDSRQGDRLQLLEDVGILNTGKLEDLRGLVDPSANNDFLLHVNLVGTSCMRELHADSSFVLQDHVADKSFS